MIDIVVIQYSNLNPEINFSSERCNGRKLAYNLFSLAGMKINTQKIVSPQ